MEISETCKVNCKLTCAVNSSFLHIKDGLVKLVVAVCLHKFVCYFVIYRVATKSRTKVRFYGHPYGLPQVNVLNY